MTRQKENWKATEAQSDRESKDSHHKGIPKPKTAPSHTQTKMTKVRAKKDDSKSKNTDKKPASKVGDKKDITNPCMEKTIADLQKKADAETKKWMQFRDKLPKL